MTYRDKLDIVADILTVASQSAKRTQIMYKANLSYKLLCKYLDEITSASLLCFENEQQCYVLTRKGKEFLDAYKKYFKTNKAVEKELDDMHTQRKALERLCINK